MQIEPYVSQVQAQIAAAAAIGDDAAKAVAEALSVASGPAVRWAVMGAVSAAADEITAALLDCPGAPSVAIRLDGEELRVDVRPNESEPGDAGEEQAAMADDTDSTARISLRLPEAMKGQMELVARSSGVSVNTWIIQAISKTLAGSGSYRRRGSPWDSGAGQRLTGWING
jgi:Arc-like DNA binding domain